MALRLRPLAVLNRLRSTYWFVPAVVTVAAVALAILAFALNCVAPSGSKRTCLVDAAFDPIARYAGRNPATAQRLLETLGVLADVAQRSEDREAIAHLADFVWTSSGEEVEGERHTSALARLRRDVQRRLRNAEDERDSRVDDRQHLDFGLLRPRTCCDRRYGRRAGGGPVSRDEDLHVNLPSFRQK
jgi:uncharacterized membrane protein